MSLIWQALFGIVGVTLFMLVIGVVADRLSYGNWIWSTWRGWRR